MKRGCSAASHGFTLPHGVPRAAVGATQRVAYRPAALPPCALCTEACCCLENAALALRTLHMLHLSRIDNAMNWNLGKRAHRLRQVV